MKKRIQTSVFKIAFMVICIMGITSCTDAKKPEDTKEVAEEHNEAKFNTTPEEKNSQFLVDAAEMNLEEIRLAQLTQQNSNMSDVRELGKMMEKGHRKSLVDLSTLAGKKMITLPTSLTNNARDAYDKLNRKSGTEFNTEYCEITVKRHKDAIALFEKAMLESSDSDIREWASATLPDLRTHLDHALTCQKKCENNN